MASINPGDSSYLPKHLAQLLKDIIALLRAVNAANQDLQLAHQLLEHLQIVLRDIPHPTID